MPIQNMLMRKSVWHKISKFTRMQFKFSRKPHKAIAESEKERTGAREKGKITAFSNEQD